jgi:ABC-type sugar transport system ATPase subunit
LPVEHDALAFGGVDIAVPEAVRNGHSELIVGLRPESLALSADGCGAVVEVVEEIGADTHVFCAAQIGGQDTKLVARVPTAVAPEQGARVHLRPTGDDVHFFDPASGLRLS